MDFLRLLPQFHVYAEELQNLEGGVATIRSLETLFANFVSTIVAISGVALFLMFVTSGFTYLFAGGDQKKMEQAKGTLTNAVIGLVVIVAAYLIIRIISVFTGVDQILQFAIPT